jgi:hypothetical protein
MDKPPLTSSHDSKIPKRGNSPIYDPSLGTSPYQQALEQGILPPNVEKCAFCDGTGGKISPCLNCDGRGGVLKEDASAMPSTDPEHPGEPRFTQK